jgi:hypothetical protein
LRVSGKATPEIEKPDPDTVAELMLTAAFPVELKVSVCAVDVLTATLPKEMLVALTASVGVVAFSCKPNVSETLPALAVKVSACAVRTAKTVAEKPALAAPAGTITVAGTDTAELLLVRFTANPPLAAAAFSVTVQASVLDPVMDALPQESADKTGTPVPLRPITTEEPLEPSLASVNCPAITPAAVGLNCTFNMADWPGLRETGRAAPETVKPAPLSVAESIVTAAAPVEVKVTDCVACALTETLPKLRLAALMVSPGLATLTSRAKFAEMSPAVAVSVTDCGPLIGETATEKAALVTSAATVTEDGTLTSGLLLARFTRKPPLGAAVLNVTVHVSVPEPMIEPLLHVSELNTGAGVFAAMPVPLKLIISVPFVAESLMTVNSPFAAPEADGSNCTVTL